MSHEHHHNHQGAACCAPVEEKSMGIKKDLLYAILCGILLLVAFLLETFTPISFWVYFSLYMACYFFGGYYTFLHSWESLRKKKFDIDFLMLVAAIGAASLGKFAEGGLLLFLFSLGHSLENYAMDKASKSIAALSELAPKTALLKVNGQVRETPISQLKLNDTIVVRPNSKIAADGVVIQGESPVNQAPITGESVPVDKYPVPADTIFTFDNAPSSHKVYAGSINGNAALEIKVLRLAKDSTLSKLVSLVQNAETHKAPAQKFADKFAAIFVPGVLVLVVVLMFAFLVIDESFKDSFYRSMAVLIAASPCALAISTPSAVLAGIARAAKGGILIKGGLPLQEMATIDSIAFDKTGTLTTGEPKLTAVKPTGNHSEEELLRLAIAVEALSDHPLARAIVRDGKAQLGVSDLPKATHLKSLIARGVSAEVEGKIVYIGNRRLAREVSGKEIPTELERDLSQLEEEGNTAMIVLEESESIGLVAVRDVARPEAAKSIQRLKSQLGIKKIMMLTGDNQRVADAIAKETGITDAVGDLLPEGKVEAIKQEKKHSKIAMVGDGVNDAPAMATANVGISMGAAGSDVALETANVALLGDSIRHLPFALLLAKQSARIIKQNLFISIGVMAILVPLTISGMTIGPAVIFHEGSTLLVVANALRLLGFKEPQP